MFKFQSLSAKIQYMYFNQYSLKHSYKFTGKVKILANYKHFIPNFHKRTPRLTTIHIIYFSTVTKKRSSTIYFNFTVDVHKFSRENFTLYYNVIYIIYILYYKIYKMNLPMTETTMTSAVPLLPKEKHDP